jgi:hypothetical protein
VQFGRTRPSRTLRAFTFEIPGGAGEGVPAGRGLPRPVRIGPTESHQAALERTSRSCPLIEQRNCTGAIRSPTESNMGQDRPQPDRVGLAEKSESGLNSSSTVNAVLIKRL